MPLFFLTFLLLACNPEVDTDGDGYAETEDCNDADASVHPGATEACNGVDDNCDGDVDEGLLAAYYPDDDGDGYGDGSATPVQACEAPSGHVADATDCDDNGPSIHPGATDAPGDDFDEDCDGFVSCYTDADNDGHGVGAGVTSSHTATGGTAATAGACDSSAFDGYADDASDCDDLVPTTFPGATEVAGDDVDDNCDGTVACYVDSDDDGYGAGAGVESTHSATAGVADTAAACASSTSDGYDDTADDCDDTSAAVNPGIPEFSGDDVDDNCDGTVACHVDGDNDGYGAGAGVESTYTATDGVADVTSACDSSPSDGYSGVATDCDDGTATTFPGATEVAGDDADDNCDGTVACYVDSDDDGYGTFASGESAHSATDGVADTAGACDSSTSDGYDDTADDCDDTSAAVNPGIPEISGDDVDDNCDGTVACYVDADNDGYGTGAGVESTYTATGGVADVTGACNDSNADGYSGVGTDCDDGTATTFPGATEVAGDDADDNCDGTVACYVDADNDGHGTFVSGESAHGATDGVADTTGACASSTADGYDDGDTDCDDAVATTHPGATDVPGDDTDDNCDGTVACYVDADNDTYGTGAGVESGYSATAGAADLSGACASSPSDSYDDDAADCDDTSVNHSPAAPEVCDGADSDCDNTPDNGGDCLAVGDIVITEVMSNPTAVADATGEWFELYNRSTRSVDLQGWAIRDNDTDLHQITASLVIDPGTRVVLARHDDALTNEDYVYGTDITLANGSDELMIATWGTDGSNGISIDEVWWDDGATYPDPTSASISLDPPHVDAASNDVGEFWCEATSTYSTGDRGTPRDPNDPCTGIDWCNVQHPAQTITKAGLDSELLFGRVWIDGVTVQAGEQTGIAAEVGYGPLGTDPLLTSSEWTWTAGAFNLDDAATENDEYAGVLNVPVAGDYAYAWRFSYDTAPDWAYCDFDPGVAHNTGDLYNPAEEATLEVLSHQLNGNYTPQDFDVAHDGSATVVGVDSATGEVWAECFDGVGAQIGEVLIETVDPTVFYLISVRVGRAADTHQSAIGWHFYNIDWATNGFDWQSRRAHLDAGCTLSAGPEKLDLALGDGILRQVDVEMSDDGTSAFAYENQSANQYRLVMFDAAGTLIDAVQFGTGLCGNGALNRVLGMNRATGDVVTGCESMTPGATRYYQRFDATAAAIDATPVAVPTASSNAWHDFAVQMNTQGDFVYVAKDAAGIWVATFHDATGTVQGTVDTGLSGTGRIQVSAAGDFVIGSASYWEIYTPSGALMGSSSGSGYLMRLDDSDTVYTNTSSEIVVDPFPLYP